MALITLDGMLFKARIPCGSWKNPDISTKDSEFDALFKLYQLSFRNGLGHQLVWCAETITKNDGRMCGLVRSCKWTSYSHFLPANTRDNRFGFRPVLIPLSEDGQTNAPSVFTGMKDGKIVKMYSLLMDGKPVEISQGSIKRPVEYEPGAELTFTDMYFGAQYLIPFIITHGMAIPTCNLVAGVSYNDLRAFAYLGAEY